MASNPRSFLENWLNINILLKGVELESGSTDVEDQLPNCSIIEESLKLELMSKLFTDYVEAFIEEKRGIDKLAALQNFLGEYKSKQTQKAKRNLEQMRTQGSIKVMTMFFKTFFNLLKKYEFDLEFTLLHRLLKR